MKKEYFIYILRALILSFAGGFCDVYTYLTRGGVFANMQTGNLIKFIVHIINNQNFELSFFLPILCFFVGCLLANMIRNWKHQYIFILLFLSFLGCGFFPNTYECNITCVSILSVTGAMQFQAFRHCLDHYYTSTMCTNNMRLLSESIIERNKTKILFYILLISVFSIGCVVGAVVVKPLGIYSLCPFSSLYLLVLIFEIITKNKHTESVTDLK